MMKKIIGFILAFILLLAVGLCRAEETEPEVFTSGDYRYILRENGRAEIIAYLGEDEELVIPDTLDGFEVSGIGEKAFFECSFLTSVTIPDSVLKIGDRAFKGCKSLTSVTIPDSVLNIEDCAFFDCDSLISVTIPDHVFNIGKNPFVSCDHLTSIIVSPEHPYLETIDGALFSKPDKRLVCYPCGNMAESYAIPDGIEVIGNWAFCRCRFLKSITIPDSVVSIRDKAFFGCESLASVTIPGSVTCIGNEAFYSCSSLTSVTILDGVDSIGDEAFAWCESVTSVTLPYSLTSIGDGAFRCCDSLTSITIPAGVTSIGDDAFSIVDITITVARGSYALQYCKNYNRAYIDLDPFDLMPDSHLTVLEGDWKLTDVRGQKNASPDDVALAKEMIDSGEMAMRFCFTGNKVTASRHMDGIDETYSGIFVIVGNTFIIRQEGKTFSGDPLEFRMDGDTLEMMFGDAILIFTRQ